MIERPQPSEHEPYYRVYIDRVPEGADVLEVLDNEIGRTVGPLRAVPAEWGRHRYADGKWTLAEVLGHMIDVERVFGFRALSMARADPAPIPGMEQDDWAAEAGSDDRPFGDLLDELEAVRASTLAMLRSFPKAAWTRRGIASGFPFTVRVFPYIIAGHELHHRDVIEERYLAPLREDAGTACYREGARKYRNALRDLAE